MRGLCAVVAVFIGSVAALAGPAPGSAPPVDWVNGKPVAQGFPTIRTVAVGILQANELAAGPFDYHYAAGDQPALGIACGYATIRVTVLRQGGAGDPIAEVDLACTEGATRLPLPAVTADTVVSISVKRVMGSDGASPDVAVPYSIMTGSLIAEDGTEWVGQNAKVIVSNGDSLWRIAESELKSRNGDFLGRKKGAQHQAIDCFWHVIWDANRDSIRNPDLIFPFQAIFLPESECRRSKGAAPKP